MRANPELSVRSSRSSDLDAVVAIFLGAIREVAGKDYDPAQIDAWGWVDRDAWAKRRPSRPGWVALRDAAVIGFADLEPDGHLDLMYVHPAHQRIGVASLLLATIEADAKVQKLSRLFTEASVTARPFFEKRGFAVLAEQLVVLRGQRLAKFRMEKSL